MYKGVFFGELDKLEFVIEQHEMSFREIKQFSLTSFSLFQIQNPLIKH